MNLQVSSKSGMGRNEGEKKILSSKASAQKYSTSNSTSCNNLISMDKDEFPSLSEIYEKISDISFSSEINLSYSDKLKSTPLHQVSQSKLLVKSDDKKLNVPKCVSKTKYDLIKNVNYNKTTTSSSQSIKKNEITESKKSYASTLENSANSSHFQKRNFNCNQWTKEYCSKSLLKQENPVESLSNSHFASACISNDSKNKNIAQHVSHAFNYYSKTVNCNAASNNGNLGKIDGEDYHVGKSKKRRKSKVKRQIAFQSGKITLLSPEIHSKILNQSSTAKLQSSRNNVTDIKNEEEYPELGVTLVPVTAIQEEIESVSANTQNKISGKLLDFCASSGFTSSEELSNGNFKEIAQVSVPEGKDDLEIKPSNKSVHPNDPITISIFDILSKDKIKVKSKTSKEEVIVPTNVCMRKEKMKKSIRHPHNILDSAPALKRGKERENPKQKKPSHLKKIILLDRKIRRENFLMLRMNMSEEEKIKENNCHGSYILDFGNKHEKTNMLPNDDLDVVISDNLNCLDSLEDLTKVADMQLFDNDWSKTPDSLYDKKNIENSMLIEHKSLNKLNNCFGKDHVKNESFNDKTKVCSPGAKKEQKITSELYFMKNNNVELHDSVVKLEKHEMEISDKEKASKIVLHTRNFREYCNHLISKEIDDGVFALLDDLARFQDRMHQKDPVKARMKRRMVYGIKEIKKHIKLKKLKCIIIAPDLENIETEGGLNDILNEIKCLASDHHIPCIFALGRKTLGKVCHKSVPVSCIGIFSYEGSEVNFKKVIELQSQSLKDYAILLDKVMQKISKEQATIFIKAKKEAPETLSNLRSDFLREIFFPSAAEEQSTVSEDKSEV